MIIASNKQIQAMEDLCYWCRNHNITLIFTPDGDWIISRDEYKLKTKREQIRNHLEAEDER